MGTYITAMVEEPGSNGWEAIGVNVFDIKCYDIFAWLAGVRNYSAITPISEPRGFPEDAAEISLDRHEADLMTGGAHTASWLTVAELLAVDYEAEVNDRRQGGDTVPESEGVRMTLREFLGESYFVDLEKLRDHPDARVVFWFD